MGGVGCLGSTLSPTQLQASLYLHQLRHQLHCLGSVFSPTQLQALLYLHQFWHQLFYLLLELLIKLCQVQCLCFRQLLNGQTLRSPEVGLV